MQFKWKAATRQILVGFLVCGAFSVTGQARAEQPWQISSYPEKIYSAFLRNEDLSRIVIECRDPRFSAPEISVTLVLQGQAKLNSPDNFVAIIGVGDKSFKLPMTRISDADQEVEYRWTATGPASFRNFADIAEALSMGRTLTVRGGSGDEEFSYDQATASGATGVISRCSPASVQARHEVENSKDINGLLVLEGSADNKCRGGPGNQPATYVACDERTEYVDRLHMLGMCYGQKGQAGYQLRWHRCGPNSIR